MPNPSFVPLIGSSFDNLAGQQYQWAGFNRGVEENNLARQAQAQAVQNDWLRNVAAIQQQANNADTAEQDASAERARSLAFRQQDLAREDRSQAAALGLEKSRVAAERERTAKMGELQSTTLALKNQQAQQAIDAAGQTAASSYLLAQKHADQAGHAFESVQADINDLEKARQAEMDKPKHDNAKVMDLNNRIKMAQSGLRQAETAKNRAENAFESLRLHIQNRGFEVDDENQVIKHGPSGKSWKFSTVLRQAQDNLPETTATGDSGEGLDAGTTWGRSFSPAGVADAATATGTAMAPVTGAFKVGKFTVLPQ